MKLTIATSVVLFLTIAIRFKESDGQERKPIFCYWGTWSHYRTSNGQFRVDNIDGNLCTHLNYAFMGVSSTGDVRILDEWLDITLGNIRNTVALKNKYPHLKVLASIGGFNEGSYNFSQVAKSEITRKVFATNVLNLLSEYGFDGVDIDWEWPGQNGGDPMVDKANFNLMLQELNQRLKPHGKLLTIATAAAESSVSISYDLSEISKWVDYILVMSYDFHGVWDGVTGINSPVYDGPYDLTTHSKTLNIHASISYFLSQGTPASKLVLGIPLYGRTYQLTDRSRNGVNAPIVGGGRQGPYTQTSGFMGYNEICELQLTTPMTRVMETNQKAPYFHYDDQWISVDDMESVAAKTHYAIARRLGGVMVWSIETDDFRGICNQGRFSLLSTINRVWNGGSVTSEPPQTQPQTTTASWQQQTTTTRFTQPQTTTFSWQPSISTTSKPGETVPICYSWGNIRNPDDCSTYYSCIGIGFPYVLMHCNPGLYYNENTDACDWPWAVIC